MTRPALADEAQARDLAIRLGGHSGADKLLAEARQQVSEICSEPAVRAWVDRIARELLRRRTLDAAQITQLLEGAEHGDQDD